MSNTFNIVDLVENNPIVKLNGDYSSKLIEKIQQTFTENQQHLFVASFYSYLNYHQTDDFVINLREIWNWLGFSRIEHCKVVLVKHFVENEDYKINFYEGVEVKLAPEVAGARSEKQHGGQNKEKILLNIQTFKKLCIKSNTKKADEIHDYFVKLENVIFQTMDDQVNELRRQLVETNETTASRIRSKEDKIIDQFPEDKMCIYVADIGVIDGLHLVKFGETNNLKQRVSSHRNTFESFELMNAYEVFNSRKFEKMLKEVPEIKYRLKHTVIKEQNRNEIIFVDERYTIEDLNKEIKSMIKKHCTIESYLADIELRKSEEKTKQDEIELRKVQEKTKQDEIEFKKIEVQEKTKQIELEMKRLGVSHQASQQIVIEKAQTKPSAKQILIKSENSKVYLLEILKRYEQLESISVKCNGFGHYNGYSKAFKTKIEQLIKDEFGLLPVKSMGKIYYLGLSFNGCTSFYDNKVYEKFVADYITILPDEIRFEKIPPGEYKYKLESEVLFKKFCEYSKEFQELYEKHSPSGLYTILYKKEFISKICEICDVRQPSYTNKTIKYFNGIIFK